ncbi:hypothetical protein MMC07_004375 [Pseudocyphellaria aurata]|nr:hypothetical protein [Pseudocyphellaria aurata]
MPHKHKRDKSKNESFYDLPPTTIAHPLPVLKTATPQTKLSTAEFRHSLKPRWKQGLGDDTPRAFTRLMNPQTTGWKPSKGLDDGDSASKKRKRSTESNTTATTPAEPGSVVPTILPTEPLSVFSARVDAAIPVSGLARSKHSSVTVVGPRERQTKMEKRMQKMQAEWREAAAKRKDKLAEEEEVEENEGGDGFGDGKGFGVSGSGKARRKIKIKGKTKRRKASATTGDDEIVDYDDSWAAIVAKQLGNRSNTASRSRSAGLVGLHDVVLAPPKFSEILKGKLMAENTSFGGARHVRSVSKKASTIGLKKQEELGEARRSVVEAYRRIMNERREEDKQ